MGGFKNRKKETFKTYGWGRGVLVFDELKRSLAYRCLTPNEKLILQEAIRCYMSVSHFDKEDISKTGFSFCYAHCLEDLTEKTFMAGRRRLVEMGFLENAPQLKEFKSGAPNIYLPSEKWKTFKPDAPTAKALNKKTADKEQCLFEKRKRRAEFRAGLKAKRVGKIYPDKTGKIYPDTKPKKGKEAGKIYPDASPKNTVVDKKNLPRSYKAIAYGKTSEAETGCRVSASKATGSTSLPLCLILNSFAPDMRAWFERQFKDLQVNTFVERDDLRQIANAADLHTAVSEVCRKRHIYLWPYAGRDANAQSAGDS